MWECYKNDIFQEIDSMHSSKTNKCKRFHAYALYIQKIKKNVKKEDWDGKGSTATLNPRFCAESGIKHRWPDVNGIYTGYKTHEQRHKKSKHK